MSMWRSSRKKWMNSGYEEQQKQQHIEALNFKHNCRHTMTIIGLCKRRWSLMYSAASSIIVSHCRHGRNITLWSVTRMVMYMSCMTLLIVMNSFIRLHFFCFFSGQIVFYFSPDIFIAAILWLLCACTYCLYLVIICMKYDALVLWTMSFRILFTAFFMFVLIGLGVRVLCSSHYVVDLIWWYTMLDCERN